MKAIKTLQTYWGQVISACNLVKDMLSEPPYDTVLEITNARGYITDDIEAFLEYEGYDVEFKENGDIVAYRNEAEEIIECLFDEGIEARIKMVGKTAS